MSYLGQSEINLARTHIKIYYNKQSAIVVDEKNRTFRHAALDEARKIKGHSSYRAELYYIEEYFLNIGYQKNK